MKTLIEKLNLTPDQHEQFANLLPFQIAHLESIPECEQRLIGELWRASKEVRETNFRGSPQDRFKAWTDLRVVQWKLAILNGRNPHHFEEMLPESDIEAFKKGLTEERIDFDCWEVIHGERVVVRFSFCPSREEVKARRAAARNARNA